MPRTHFVQPGECLTSIAAAYGFVDPNAIWQSNDNADLRARRPDPSIIRPGDEIVIPDLDRVPLTVKKPTGDYHRIDVILPRRKFLIKLAPMDDQPFDGQPFRLEAGGQTVTGNVGGDGVVEGEARTDATRATLTLPQANLTMEVAIGHLDPVHDGDADTPIVSGVQARLINLGYLGGSVTGLLDDATVAAIKSFQANLMERAAPDGELDDETLDRLVDAHGC